MQAPTLELNEGDVVMIMNSPTIIAASTPRFRGSIGLWLYEAALAGARDDERSDGGRIYWAAPERALGAVRAAICHDMGKDAFRALVRRSGEMSIEDAATALRLCARDELGLHILTNTHRLVASRQRA